MTSRSACFAVTSHLAQCTQGPRMLSLVTGCAFSWLSNIPLCVYRICTHSSFYGQLGCFHILAIVNGIAINMRVRISFWYPIFVFFGHIPRSGIAGSYGALIFFFKIFFLEKGLFKCDYEYLKVKIGMYFLKTIWIDGSPWLSNPWSMTKVEKQRQTSEFFNI